MTEKRFTEIISTQKVIDNKTGKEYDCLLDNDFYDLVNGIAEENEDLKNNIGEQGVKLDFAICETQDFKNKWLKLKKENEQLKKRLIKLKVENVELKEENEKLWCDGE